jgi:ATP-dependent Clp protease ATP-binding subunit ClpC
VILKKSKIPQSYKKLVDKSFEVLNSLDEHVERGQYDTALKLRNDLRGLETKLVNKEEKIFIGESLVLRVEDVNEAVNTFSDDKRDDVDKIGVAKLSTLSDNIKKKIIGQDHAVDTVVKSIIRARLGLRSRKRTMGNFLFLGPTGVGKTELAKVLADEFYGEKSLIRLDMSDFSEKHNVARLIGAPPGYVGYGEGGELTSKIENRPDSVVLFDEIEKAHPDVLNILLQIMEEAELSDAKGNVFDFSKAVVILTSNLGTEILHNSQIGFEDKNLSDKSVEGRLRFNLKKILKPELINRFDDIIIFRKLRRESQLRVLEVLIKDITTTLGLQRIKLRVSNSTKNHILKTGYSEEYGARALKRTLEKELLDKIAEFLLKHRSKPVELTIDIENNDVIVKSKIKKK